MGERTFGKGSVQTLLPLSNTTALRLTTARYYTPSGWSVQEGGLEPDIRVPQISDPDYKTRPRFRDSDLRPHLITAAKEDNSILRADNKEEQSFKATAEALDKHDIEEFRRTYTHATLPRHGQPPTP